MKALFQRAFAKGFLGGSRPWLYVWVGMLSIRLLRRLTRNKPDVLYCEELRDGEALVISART